MRIKVIKTSGTKRVWSFFSQDGLMLGCNIWPGHFGLAISVTVTQCQ